MNGMSKINEFQVFKTTGQNLDLMKFSYFNLRHKRSHVTWYLMGSLMEGEKKGCHLMTNP